MRTFTFTLLTILFTLPDKLVHILIKASHLREYWVIKGGKLNNSEIEVNTTAGTKPLSAKRFLWKYGNCNNVTMLSSSSEPENHAPSGLVIDSTRLCGLVAKPISQLLRYELNC